MRRALRSAAILLLCALPFAACGGGGGGDETGPERACVPGSGNCFNLALFESNLVDAVHLKTVGYSYAISSDATLYSSGGFGWSRVPADGGLSMTADRRMNIASITKTITAIAALQVMYDRGIGIDSSISFFLPAHWSLGPNIHMISFRDLLRHTSGIRDVSGSCDNADELTYEMTKTRISDGIQAADHGT